MLPELSFRPIDPEVDRPFLLRVYSSTREEEMAMVPWDEGEKRSFLEMQFRAQHVHYMEHFSQASFDLILCEGEPVGRLYVDRRPDEIRLIDIALLPEHRGRGLGGSIMADLLAEGEGQGLPVQIHVEQNNPAMRLYERLGFEKVEDQGVYHLMKWTPPAHSPA